MIRIQVGHRYLLKSGAVAVCYYKVRNQDKYLMLVIGKQQIFYTRQYVNNDGDQELDITQDLGVIV